MAASIPLAANFATASEETWRKEAERSTGPGGVARLASTSEDGITVGPLYGQAAAGRIVTGREPGLAWSVIQRIDEMSADAAAAALASDVAGGANGGCLVFPDSATSHGRGLAALDDRGLATLVATVGDAPWAWRIDGGEASFAIAGRLLDRLVAGGGRRTSLDVDFDPLAHLAATGSLARPLAETVRRAADHLDRLEAAGIAGSVLVADGRPWHDGGASVADELGIALAAFVADLRLLAEAGIAPDRAAARIGAALAADADQFMTIAKFRAMRLLHARLLEAAALPVGSLALHGETSWRMLSRRDAHVNVLRATTAAFAAGVGGADTVSVLPFDDASAARDGNARRLARNTQTVLLAEAYVARVADPGAGSGAIEALTEALAEAAWSRFQAIEADGGLAAAIVSDAIQRRIAAAASVRRERLARRDEVLTGVSAYPNLAETVPVPVPAETPAPPGGAVTAEPLVRERLAAPFEALRDTAEGLAAAGVRPGVFIVGLGRPAGEIVAEAAGFFASGGIAATVAPVTASPEAAAEAFAGSGLTLACVAVSPKAATAEAAPFVAALKGAGAARVHLFAARSDAAEGADVVLGAHSDAVAVLRESLALLAKA